MAFGVDETSREQLAARARRYNYLHQRIYETDALMIDEISVIKNNHLELLKFGVNSVRDSERNLVSHRLRETQHCLLKEFRW